MLPVTTSQLVGFGVAAFVLIAIPGPSVVFVVGRALAHGRGVALASVVGNTIGLAVILLLVAFGLGAVVTTSATVFLVVKLVGATYLIWLGVQAIRHRNDEVAVTDDTVSRGLSSRVAIRQGFVVGISNPKAFLIFAALLPPFVRPEAGQVTLQLLTLGLMAVVIGLLSDSVWAITAAGLRDWFAASPSRGAAMGWVGGGSLVALGAGLAATGNH
ncbi:LysE family translocator [Nocardioides daejeonensis]|uniref:LysE family translocator n=1 Tax=Nocardioides daejeonensis TaxID=1046556 RepID=UPI000D74FBD9|nr:LysE family translocator [Nocardioides daejeonensis]